MTKHLITAVVAVALVAPVAGQQSAQKLFERGAYDEAVQRVNEERGAGNNDLAAAYLAGLAYEKLGRGQDARAEYARLSGSDNETWHAIGQSAIALLDGAMDEAVGEGRKARDLTGENGWAYYQLGMVHLKRSEFNDAARALDRAAELMGEFAYAHYYAGIAHQREKRFNQMAEHFQVFLKLAPDAPEKKQVQLALNSLRG